MGRQGIKASKTSRRLNRPQLSFQVDHQTMERLKEATAISGHSMSGECEDRLKQTFAAHDMMTLRYGANAPLIETIADAADAARRWGEMLVADGGIDQDDGDVRIYSAVFEAVRLILKWHDPASDGKIYNPRHVGDGALTWETLPAHAAWSAYNRVGMDPKRLAVFKAIGAKFQKHKRTR